MQQQAVFALAADRTQLPGWSAFQPEIAMEYDSYRRIYIADGHVVEDHRPDCARGQQGVQLSTMRIIACTLLVLSSAACLPAWTVGPFNVLYGATGQGPSSDATALASSGRTRNASPGFAAGSGGGILVVLNPANGAILSSLPLTDSGGNGYNLTGLATQPSTGVLYGSTSNGSATSPRSLVTVNPANGRVTLIATFGSAGPFPDITFTPDGRLWGWDHNSNQLMLINTVTASLLAVTGPAGVSNFGDGIASDSSGVLFFAGDGDLGDLHRIVVTAGPSPTGVMTTVETMNGPNDSSIAAMKFFGSTLYAVDVPYLVTIDTSTANVTILGTVPDTLDAITFGPAVTAPPPPTVPATSSLLLIPIGLIAIAVYFLRLRPRQVGC